MHVRLEAASFFFQSQSMQHCFCCVLLGSRIKVRVDVGCRAEIALPQPLLNLFEQHMVRKQQARAAVPQVVKANMPQMVLLKRQLEHR